MLIIEMHEINGKLVFGRFIYGKLVYCRAKYPEIFEKGNIVNIYA